MFIVFNGGIMLKFYKLTTALIVLGLSTSSLAAAKAPVDYDSDYDSGFYENEGRINLKLRAFGSITKAKQKNLPAPTKSPVAPNNHFLANGYGIEGATTLFFGDYVAAELGIGLGLYKVSSSTVANVGNNYSASPNQGKRHPLYNIPVTFIPQVHLAPFGAIRPYAGAGYSGVYFFTQAKEYRVKSTTGPVIQLGVDFVMTDDTMLNFYIKKYWITPRVTYKSGFLGANAPFVSSKLPINPLVVSIGFGYKF